MLRPDKEQPKINVPAANKAAAPLFNLLIAMLASDS
jgi:hypothetical protein